MSFFTMKYYLGGDTIVLEDDFGNLKCELAAPEIFEPGQSEDELQGLFDPSELPKGHKEELAILQELEADKFADELQIYAFPGEYLIVGHRAQRHLFIRVNWETYLILSMQDLQHWAAFPGDTTIDHPICATFLEQNWGTDDEGLYYYDEGDERQ